MKALKWWFIRNFMASKCFSCYNDKLDNFQLGEVYQEWTKFYYIKAGETTLYIKYK